MDANHYVKGAVVTLRCLVTVDGEATDPSTPEVRVREPDGNLVTATPSNLTVGELTYNFATTKIGTHHYRFSGTGAAPGAGERSFIVDHSQVV